MALIDCPKCKKKISNKIPNCNHCGVDINNPDLTESNKKVSYIARHQRIMNHSFIAMLLFCGGFLFMFWQNPAKNSWQEVCAIGATAFGFCWYIICRVRLIILKRK